MRASFALIALALAMMSAFSTLATADDAAPSGVTKVPVAGIAQTKLELDFPAPIGKRTLSVDDPTAILKLGEIHATDIVEIKVDDITNPQHVLQLLTIARPVSGGCRLAALLIPSFIIFMAALAVARRLGKPVHGFLLGADGRYSNSKFQMALWFGAVMMIYLATIILRARIWGLDFLYGVEIPANLLALSGLSALSFGGAKAITTIKVDNAAQDAVNKSEQAARAADQANAAATQAKEANRIGAPTEVVEAHNRAATVAASTEKKLADEATAAQNPKPQGTPNIFADLLQNDKGDPDIGDFQMIFISLLAAITFVIVGYNFLGTIVQSAHVNLPDVDTALLSGFGLGHGAYLIKKIASKPGEG